MSTGLLIALLQGKALLCGLANGWQEESESHFKDKVCLETFLCLAYSSNRMQLMGYIIMMKRRFMTGKVHYERWLLLFFILIWCSNEHSGLISFRMDWLDLLAVQGTLKSLLPTPQFKSINSSVLSFLHSPTLISIHDYWKNHGLDQMDLCWQSNVSAFLF